MRSFGEHTPERIAKKRSAPELQALPGCGIPANVAGFKTNAIHDGHIHTISNSMGALNRAPGIVLRDTELSLLRRMPSDSGWIEQNICTLQRGEPRPLRIPLVPADKSAEAPGTGVESAISQISWREIKLLVIEGIVRNVHLAIEPAQRSVAVEDRCRVVIHAQRSLLEKRRDHDDAIVACRRGKFLSTWSGDWLGQIEQRVIFSLTEILRLEKLGEADDLRAFSCRVSDARQSLFEILFRFRPARHLHQSHTVFLRGHAFTPPRFNIAFSADSNWWMPNGISGPVLIEDACQARIASHDFFQPPHGVRRRTGPQDRLNGTLSLQRFRAHLLEKKFERCLVAAKRNRRKQNGAPPWIPGVEKMLLQTLESLNRMSACNGQGSLTGRIVRARKKLTDPRDSTYPINAQNAAVASPHNFRLVIPQNRARTQQQHRRRRCELSHRAQHLNAHHLVLVGEKVD